MKKLLVLAACFGFFACTNPEHTVDDAADTTGLNYNPDRSYNTSPGPTTDDTVQGAGIDTSNPPKDTARATKR